MDHGLSRPCESVSRFELENRINFSLPLNVMDVHSTASDPVIKYINDMLLGDSIDENTHSMLYDPLVLRAAENSFYEALHDNNGVDTTSETTIGSFNTNQWIVDPEESKSSPDGDPPDLSFPSSSQTKSDSLNTDFSRRKKHNNPDERGLEEEEEEEERSTKYSAVYNVEVELSEMFDKVLICTDNIIVGGKGIMEQKKGKRSRKSNSKKHGVSSEIIDLGSLLTNCAQSIAFLDDRAAREQLKKIRQHSSLTGDAIQRMAHAFANALEARLNGTGPQLCAALGPFKVTSSDLLRSHFISWPVLRISYIVCNTMIYEIASKCTSLHVMDFGISYGVQWPTLIRDLSRRPGGPPKLRITGVELPQLCFCPEQMVEETGCRLAKYCEHFGVPFEYNAITRKNWEKITIDDLKLVRGEVVAVKCAFRLKSLMDETVGADNPRVAFLNMLREITPQIFVQTVMSGSHGCTFFLSRFREAMSFYSAIYDMYDSTLPLDDDRFCFEQQILAREIMNVIGCEGMERLERPETYKQWESRNIRAGFKPMPMNTLLLKKLRQKVKDGYHKDFVFDEDRHWILQGWKGWIICATACWVPA
ncbi:unnamed protein product [Cuscuta epithymum]|uniref:Uncharacterized protein n=1 Tax=Cuscuta epithymum TaxID=186058 RepID=A0AAV0CI69_9ASTE|nr:unnamed protein product [Cuscuta epithymum]